MKIDPSRRTLKHVILKMTKYKFKVRIFTIVRSEKKLIYEGIPIKYAVDLSNETLGAR